MTTKLLPVTDTDGDLVAVPVADIALVTKPPKRSDGIITGARGLIITHAGWQLEVREAPADIIAAVNGGSARLN